ncbi:hypothetical protein ACFLTP_08715 [Chloroflexota bacterium]
MVKVLNIFGVSILTFLLLLALTIFSLAFWINSTALNPRFMISEINRLDFVLLVQDTLTSQNQEGISQELETAVVNYIKEIEPQIKMQVDVAVHSVYDYLLGKKSNPELAKTLRSTFLSSEFVTSAVNSLDIATIANEVIEEQMELQIPSGLSWFKDYMDQNLKKLLIELEPSIKEQIKKAADPIADYLVGNDRSFTVVIQTKPLVEAVKQDLLQYVLTSPPPELAELSQSAIEANFDALFNQVVPAIPASFEVNETTIGTDVPAQIATSIGEAEKGLTQVRPYISYFQLGFWLLIAFMALIIVGIIFIYRQVKPIAINLGITFVTFGIIELAAFFIVKYFGAQQLAQFSGIPVALQAWLPQLFNHFMAPILTIGIGSAVVGLALIIISIVYKPREATE